MNPDISFLTNDPDLGAVSFPVIRSSGFFDHGELIRTSVIHQASGIIQPGSISYTDQQSGEDKQPCEIIVYTKFALTAGQNTGDSVTPADEIRYNNRYWRVTKVWRFSQGDNTERLENGYCIAVACLINDLSE